MSTLNSQRVGVSFSPSAEPPVGPAPPGYFTRKGKHYRSTALTLYVFTASQAGIFDSGAITRSTADGHVPVLSSDGDRKELGKMVLSTSYNKWMVHSAPPRFGVQTKIDVLPHYETGVFQFVHIVLSTVIDADFERLGAVAAAVKLTIYTPSDYIIWLNNMPFLRMLLNCAVTVTSSALIDRFNARMKSSKHVYSFRSYAPLEAEAKRLAGLVASFLAADQQLPSVHALPRRTLPAPRLFRSEYGVTVAEALSACLKSLGTQPAFLSSVIVGCISCSNWVDYIGGSGGRDAVGKVDYSHYYTHELPLTRVSRSAKIVEDGWAEDDTYLVDHTFADDDDDYEGEECFDHDAGGSDVDSLNSPDKAEGGVREETKSGDLDLGLGPTSSEHQPSNAGARKAFSSVPGGAWQSSRIIIVGAEWQVMPLLMVCIFFYKKGRILSGADPSRFTHLFGDAAEDLLPLFIAARTNALSTSYPIQWLDAPSLTHEDMMTIFDSRNDEGTILVIDAPNGKVTRYELEKSYHEPCETYGADGRIKSVHFGAFSLDGVRELELHADETIMRWVEEAVGLAGMCGVDFYLQEQLNLTYQRALMYEQLVGSGMLDAYDYEIGFVTVRPPTKGAGPHGHGGGGGGGGKGHGILKGQGALGLVSAMASQRLTAGALSSRSVGGPGSSPFGNLTRPDYGGDYDTRSEGGSSHASSYSGVGARGGLGRRASTVIDDDIHSTTSSIAPSPMLTMQDAQTRVWMAGMRSRATEEERFVMDHRFKVEGMLGAEYTPSHGQLLHLLRFQQPSFFYSQA